MKKPLLPPQIPDIIRKLEAQNRLEEIFELARLQPFTGDYLHWDRLYHLRPPDGFTVEEWWLVIKLQRRGFLRQIPFKDKQRRSFQFLLPDVVQEQLHQIDMGAGGTIGIPEPIVNPQTRDQYYIKSLIQEAVTSSQLEGAATTRKIAKEMIQTGRKPRDRSEQMILNNYMTMRRIAELKSEPLTPALVFEIHRLITEKTLDDPAAAGRLRRSDERRVVADVKGNIYHDPPPADELPERLAAMCAFANGETPDYFIHPTIRAIILHFWLAYDHPFVDGNGRTARAIFYWAMLRQGFWLFEFISISSILLKAPTKYARSFLYTETDDNDLTYFIVAQMEAIQKATRELHSYIDRKAQEVHEIETRMRILDRFNHRQAALIRHALKHPFQEYTVGSHRKSHNVVYETSRTDLLNLYQRGILEMKKRGKTIVFTVPRDLSDRLKRLE